MKTGMIIELWMDNEAEEAARFYVSIFKDSSLGDITPYTTDTPSHKPIGSILTVDFTLNGQRFQALNGGPDFKFSEAVSFIVECEDQEEIDYYWEKLSYQKEAEACGWCKDKYGVSWQIVPKDLESMLHHAEPEKSKRAMDALLKMKKIDIKTILEVAR